MTEATTSSSETVSLIGEETPIFNPSERASSDRIARTLYILSSYLTEPFCRYAEECTALKGKWTSNLNGYSKEYQEVLHRLSFVGLNCLALYGAWVNPLCALKFLGGNIGLFVTTKLIRQAAIRSLKGGFIYVKGQGREISLFPDKDGYVEIGILFANILGPGGGYAQTNGGACNFRHRGKEIVNQTVKTLIDNGNPVHVASWLEEYDTAVGEQLKSETDQYFSHHIMQCGADILLGNRGGEMQSLNLPLHSVERISFSNNPMLIDTPHIKAQMLNRGLLKTGIKLNPSSKKPFLNLGLTHLIHGTSAANKSDASDVSELRDTLALRKQELEEIRQNMPEEENCLFFGDLNIETKPEARADKDSRAITNLKKQEVETLKSYGKLAFNGTEPTCTEHFIQKWRGPSLCEKITTSFKSLFGYQNAIKELDDEGETIDNCVVLKKRVDRELVENPDVEVVSARIIPLWNKNMPISLKNPLSDHHAMYLKVKVKVSKEMLPTVEESKETSKKTK